MCKMQCVNGSASWTSWTDQLDRPAGRTSWMDQLDKPAGRTSWTDPLDGPAGRISWMDQFSLSEALASLHIRRLTFQFVHCCMLQLPSPTKALLYFDGWNALTFAQLWFELLHVLAHFNKLTLYIDDKNQLNKTKKWIRWKIKFIFQSSVFNEHPVFMGDRHGSEQLIDFVLWLLGWCKNELGGRKLDYTSLSGYLEIL